jgi:hypothetical protein
MKYDYWYRDSGLMKRKMSEIGGENLVKRKEERKKWKLPMIIDLNKVRLEERKNNVNRLGMEFREEVEEER